MGDCVGLDRDGLSLHRIAGLDGGERVSSGWEITQDEAALRAGDGEAGIGDDVDVGVHPWMAGGCDGNHELGSREGAHVAGRLRPEGEIQRGIGGDSRCDAEMSRERVAVGEIDRLARHDAEELGVEAAVELGKDGLFVRSGEGAARESAGYPEKNGRQSAGKHVVFQLILSAMIESGAGGGQRGVDGRGPGYGASEGNDALNGASGLRGNMRRSAFASCREGQDAGQRECCSAAEPHG